MKMISHKNEMKTNKHEPTCTWLLVISIITVVSFLQGGKDQRGGGCSCKHITDLMLRVSQPRRVVSLAVATWVQLWCGLHLPEVNFSCPFPSRAAELASWNVGYYFSKKRREFELFLENSRGHPTFSRLNGK
jgi:hypothetical protein